MDAAYARCVGAGPCYAHKRVGLQVHLDLSDRLLGACQSYSRVRLEGSVGIRSCPPTENASGPRRRANASKLMMVVRCQLVYSYDV